MPLVGATGTTPSYFLVCFDKDGNELGEPDGSKLSESVLAELGRPGSTTDVVLLCHGWMADKADALASYRKWLAAGLRAVWPLEGTPLVVALHWPSKAWSSDSESTTDARAPESLATPNASDTESTAADFAAALAGSPAGGGNLMPELRSILGSSNYRASDSVLPPSISRAFASLQKKLKMSPTGAQRADSPGSRFDVREAWLAQRTPEIVSTPRSVASIEGGALGLLRAFSFWTMRARGITVGETGAGDFLSAMMQSAKGHRFHLMGHSFGCLVLSSAVLKAGSANARHVHTMFLVQAAESTWAFSGAAPFAEPSRGGFADIIEQQRVDGALVATTSRFDKALGTYYPLGMSFARRGEDSARDVSADGADGDSAPASRTAAIGAVGISFDPPAGALLAPLRRGSRQTFAVEAGSQYTIDASAVIRAEQGLVGAHSDIAHVELVRLFYAAVNSMSYSR